MNFTPTFFIEGVIESLRETTTLNQIVQLKGNFAAFGQREFKNRDCYWMPTFINVPLESSKIRHRCVHMRIESLPSLSELQVATELQKNTHTFNLRISAREFPKDISCSFTTLLRVISSWRITRLHFFGKTAIVRLYFADFLSSVKKTRMLEQLYLDIFELSQEFLLQPQFEKLRDGSCPAKAILKFWTENAEKVQTKKISYENVFNNIEQKIAEFRLTAEDVNLPVADLEGRVGIKINLPNSNFSLIMDKKEITFC